MNKICKNCGESAQFNYCSNCGQSTETGRINFRYLSHEVQHSVLHVDRGILYTIKELLIKPGYIIKNYLDGKRVDYFKPFAFIFILGTIYGLIVHFLNVSPEKEMIPNGVSAEFSKSVETTIEWVYGHFSLVMLGFTFIAALSSYLVFRKSGYNYFEHLVMYSYIVGIMMFFQIISHILYYTLPVFWLIIATMLLSCCYMIWVLTQVFRKGSWFKTMIKAIICFFLAYGLWLFVSMLIGIGYALMFL